MLHEKAAEAESIITQLLNSKKYYFKDLKPSDLQDKLPVVYAIFNQETGENL